MSKVEAESGLLDALDVIASRVNGSRPLTPFPIADNSARASVNVREAAGRLMVVD